MDREDPRGEVHSYRPLAAEVQVCPALSLSLSLYISSSLFLTGNGRNVYISSSGVLPGQTGQLPDFRGVLTLPRHSELEPLDPGKATRAPVGSGGPADYSASLESVAREAGYRSGIRVTGGLGRTPGSHRSSGCSAEAR